MGNMFKTAFLLTALTLLLMFFGRYFGGQNGMFLALAFAAVMHFGGYGGGDRDRRGGGGGLAALFMLIVAPIAATLIQLAVSRSREYQADATGAHFTGNPYALASALQKLDAYSRRLPMQATPSTAHLFIIQPLLGVNFGNLFSTHPPIAKRIERLTGRPAEFMQ